MSDKYLYKIGDGTFCEHSTRPQSLNRAIKSAEKSIKSRGLNKINVQLEIIDYDTGEVVRSYYPK